ncbi:MAG: NAD(P)-dependent oxidoreductase [Myxococcota bacterium]|nr:NAD(P)-dependent oxidoreductase [Myxococcota bacterium]
MSVGFIGLGHVGTKLAKNLLESGYPLAVLDLQREAAQPLLMAGARWGETPRSLAESVDILITCLPNPAASAAVLEDPGGALEGFSDGKYWLEMSTTDSKEVRRLGQKVRDRGAWPADCPVSGGCHRAATGNISIFAGCERPVFETIFPVLSHMGREILHTGELGSASILKVLTNYLATANLVSLCEALVTAQGSGMNLATTYEAIRISSGNSFVHETESQVILNGSRDINFTMDLVLKDITLFQNLADQKNIPLELSPLLIEIFKDAAQRYGEREWSPNVIRRLEDATGSQITASGFPAEMVDYEQREQGREVFPKDQTAKAAPAPDPALKGPQ